MTKAPTPKRKTTPRRKTKAPEAPANSPEQPFMFKGQAITKDTDPSLLLDAIAWAVNGKAQAEAAAQQWREEWIRVSMSRRRKDAALQLITYGAGAVVGAVLTMAIVLYFQTAGL